MQSTQNVRLQERVCMACIISLHLKSSSGLWCLYSVRVRWERQRIFHQSLFVRVCERVRALCLACWMGPVVIDLERWTFFKSFGFNRRRTPTEMPSACACVRHYFPHSSGSWMKSPWTGGWSVEVCTHTHSLACTRSQSCVFVKASCQCCSHTPFITSY